MWTFVPPGRARAIALRSSVVKFLKAVRFSSTACNSVLTGGSTETFLIPEPTQELKREAKGAHMQIGEPLRTVIVEPLELPVEQPTREPELVPVPDNEPEQTPAAQ